MSIFKKNNFVRNKTHKQIMAKTKYKKILNNLLSVNSQSDNAVYTKISGLNLDLAKLLDAKNLEKVFSKAQFKIKLQNASNTYLVESLEECTTIKEVQSFAEENNFVITALARKALEKNFKTGLRALVTKLIKEKDLFLKRWKAYIIKVNSVYQETNIWPLFASTLFVGYNDKDTKIYAPLLLKEIQIVIEDNQVFLKSRSSSIITNDKVSFLVSEKWNIDLPIIDSDEETSLESGVNEFMQLAHNLFVNGDQKIVFTKEFMPFSNKKAIPKLESLTLFPGVVLNMCAPSGGKLREAVINLIEQDRMENLIDIDVLKDYSPMAKEMLKKQKSISRVVQTDISQELSILGALDHSAIIIGPPGTGKSQTIANILANILAQGKKALFISQKKVALDVVLKRMHKLSSLMMQFSSSQKSDKNEKAEFYKNLQEFIKHLRVYGQRSDAKVNGLEFLDKIELEYANSKQELDNIFNDKTYNAFVLLTKIYNSKINTKFDLQAYAKDIKKVYEIINQFVDKHTFEQYWSNFHLPKEQLAVKLDKVRTKIKFLKIVTYEKSFVEKYKLLEQLKELNGFANFLVEDFENIFKIKDYKSFIVHLNYYQKERQYETWFRQIKNLDNNTLHEEEKIIASYVSKIKNILETKMANDPEYAKAYKSFNGRIERAFTDPKILTLLFNPILKDIFNIVVGTPEQVSTFVDFKKDQYDYLIFDEASQMFFEKAIPFISISKKVIIAGDDQQMQPSNWFSKRWEDEDENNEMSEIQSLLDWAKQQGLPTYKLEMNYRSASSELVLFSSKHFYDSDLKTIDSMANVENAALEVIELNGKWENSINELEAQEMLKILEANLKKYQSFLLLTFNKKQQDFVVQKIIENYPKIYDLIDSGKVTVKNIENIQGDEADLVIASVCYDKYTKLGGVYVVSGSGKNALNVAITRAKYKMVVLKSIRSNELKVSNEQNSNIIIFKQWLEYLELNISTRKIYSPIKLLQDKQANMNFENEVNQWLSTEGFQKKIITKNKYSIGSYIADFAILDQKTKKLLFLVELDMFRKYAGFEQLVEERKKTDFIKAKGYKVYRIAENKWSMSKIAIKKELSDFIAK